MNIAAECALEDGSRLAAGAVARPTPLFSQPVNRRQNRFRPGPHPDIVRQVLPPDGARGIHQEFRRPRDVSPSFPALRMQHSVLPDRFGFRIGQEREFVPVGLAKFLRLGGRIHADGRHFHAAPLKLAQMLLETPQLGVAERSPVPAIENQHYCAVILQQLGGGNLFSRGILQDERRRFLVDRQGRGRGGNLLREVSDGRNEKSE